MECSTELTLGPSGGALRQYSVNRKLRLSKEQFSLLENIFRECSTPSAAAKKELAGRLNLRLEQVEVWFQNRRVRTRQKKTESDLEELKEYCETLGRYCEKTEEENRRLKREIEEMKTGKTFCLLCKNIVTGEDVHVSPRSKRLRSPGEEALSVSRRLYEMDERENEEDDFEGPSTRLTLGPTMEFPTLS